MSWTRSSASRRSRASRASAWMTAALRAVSACRPSGPSWRRISPVRSCTRVRLASIVSSLRSARSLRLRCLRTPAASSMKPRRSSGVARSTASSWPWPTMTCISRPMPQSDSSSWTSSSRQEVPLMAYSRAAVAEHRPRDRHLGVVDRQRAVGVVDGQGDLGPAERRAAGGAGEDDVLHLAAAQRLGALLAHDPGERVDDVGLAGAVGADDAGDAGLEAQVRRRGEGLEALQGQALDVHGGSRSPRSSGWLGVPGRMRPDSTRGDAEARDVAGSVVPVPMGLVVQVVTAAGVSPGRPRRSARGGG